MKCGDCTKQALLPFNDAAVYAHLKGNHVIGVYAMLDDETCWFLAVDFDKGTWTEDARAFVETARRLGLPAVVERSPFLSFFVMRVPPGRGALRWKPDRPFRRRRGPRC